MPKAAKNSTLATVRIRVLPRFCWRHYGDHPRRHYADPRHQAKRFGWTGPTLTSSAGYSPSENRS
ncbi:hypothetical protein DF137_36935, partial [Burkholderia stagnalis]